MNRISRWPARMFANSRTDSEMIRTRCEITSITNSGMAAKPVIPPGTNVFRYPMNPCLRTPSML